MDTLLEIIKITLPALTVFLTVWFILREFFKAQMQQKSLELRQQSTGTSLPLKLQAYERVILYCERLSLPNMLLRLRNQGMSNAELRLAMMVTIQQEYEYNITQQLYTSRELWEIIKLCRDNTLNIINLAYEKVDPKGDCDALADLLNHLAPQQDASGLQQAIQATKQEAALIL
jgi:hypothetical protein